MNPKEKAHDLYDAFNNPNASHQLIRLFALICVDEIIKANPHSELKADDLDGDVYVEPMKGYWKEVKEELQKM